MNHAKSGNIAVVSWDPYRPQNSFRPAHLALAADVKTKPHAHTIVRHKAEA
jgi:hypothetical protein